MKKFLVNNILCFLILTLAGQVNAAAILVGVDGTTLVGPTAANTRTALGLVIGTNVQAYDADLTTYAGITPTTVAQNLLALTNPSAITFLRMNADNTVTARSASNFRSDIGLATDVTFDNLILTGSITSIGTPLSASIGGTGLSSYAVGDLIYSSGTTALSKLADVATGSVLISGGVTTAPAWSTSLGLTSGVTAFNATAVPAGGTAGSGFKFSSTSNLGVFFGTGTPTLSAARGSLYLDNNTGGVPYYNTNGTTGWTSLAAGSGAVATDSIWTAAGQLVYGTGTATAATLAAGATTAILVGGGAAAPVWTTATGTGAPVRAGSPTLTGTVTADTFSGSGTGLTGVTLSAIVPNTAPSAGQLLVGNAGGTAYAPVSSSGDVTVGSTGAFTIGANKVTGAMIALGSDASGDVMYYNGTDYIRLPKGADGTVLKLSSGLPVWGTDATAGSPTWDTIGDAAGNGDVSFGNTSQSISSTLDNGIVLEITDTDAAAASATTLFKLSHNDGANSNVIYLSMIGDKDGTPTTDFIFRQSTGFTSLLPINPPAEAYDTTGWNSDTGAPQKDAIRDQLILGDTDGDGKIDVLDNVSAEGFLPVTSGGVPVQARTLTGTANEISISNGTGASADPVFSLPTALTFTGKTVTGGTFATPTFSGILTMGDGARVATTSAMGALSIDVTKAINTKSISADSTVTFSGTPASTTTFFGVIIKNTDTASHTVTWPSSFSMDRQTTAAHVTTVPASGRLDVQVRYDGTDYTLYGDAVTINDLTAASTDITADYLQFYDATDSLHKKVLINALGLVSDTAYSSAFNGVTTIAPSKNAIYDQLHIGDTDDDGKIDVLDIISTAGFGAFTSGGVPVQGRTLTGTANEITISNGTGASADPVWSLPTALTFTGKTVTGGTFSGIVHSGGLTASGSTANDFSGSTGTFLTSSGANTLGGDVTISGSKTFTTGTGTTTISGSLTDTASGATITLSPTGGGTVTIAPAGAAAVNAGSTLSLTSGGASAITMTSASAGTINNMSIGATTALAGTFTTLAATTTATVTSANASALAVGRLGATTPALQVDASTGTSITGIKIKSAATGGGVAISAIGEASNGALTLDAQGSGTITIGGTSTGAITLTRATTMSAALTYGGVTLSNAVTGTGNMVLATSPTLTTAVLGSSTATTQSAADNSTKVATTAYVDALNAATLSPTNKTFDAAATGNVLKLKGYIYLTHPHLADGTGATIGTTATAIGYGHAAFTDVDEAANYVEYELQVPEDIDTSVALRGRLKTLLGGTDNSHSQIFHAQSVSVADSAVPGSATLANSATITVTSDGAAASGDVFTSSWTTLTSWAGALTAGQTWRIRLARDGNDAGDTSTVTVTELGLVIEYGITQ